jgi:hypothetical protein
MTFDQISQFVDDIEMLVACNRWVGIWDNRRNEMRGLYDRDCSDNNGHWRVSDTIVCTSKAQTITRISAGSSEFLKDFVETERKSRQYVEGRAKYRSRIEDFTQSFVSAFAHRRREGFR